MGKSTRQKKDLSGTKLYVSGDGLIEPTPYFLYEVCIYKYWKNGFCQLGSKFLRSDRYLNITRRSIYKKVLDYWVEKTISMIGAPNVFIKENNLKEYKPIVKPKRKKKK